MVTCGALCYSRGMSNQIQQLPGDMPTFGYAFDYDLWSPNTKVSLCRVNWDSGYKDVVDFGTAKDRDKYFEQLESVALYTEGTYVIRPNSPTVRLDIPYNKAIEYNYIVVSQGDAPIAGGEGRKFFYFIHEVNYKAANSTEFVIQLDVWQTFYYGVTLLSGYVVRGHVGVQIANGSYYHEIYDVPESIDIGENYDRPRWLHHEAVFSQSSPILVSSTISLTKDPGTKKAANNPSAKSTNVNNMPMGLECVALKSSPDFSYYMDKMGDFSWITIGMQRAVLAPVRASVSKRIAATNANYPPRDPNKQVIIWEPPTSRNVSPIVVNNLSKTLKETLWDRSDYPKTSNIYRKIYAAPFTVIELYSTNGTSVSVNPRTQVDDTLRVEVFMGLVPWAESISFRVASDRYMHMDDLALVLRNFPTLPVVNNMANASIAAQSRSIQASRVNANWAQQRAIMGANVAMDNANIGANTASELQQMQAGANTRMTDYTNTRGLQSSIINATTGMAGSAAGGIPGLAAGALGSGAGIAGQIHGAATASQVTEMNNNTAARATNIGNQGMLAAAANNQNMAIIGAKGDYAAAINAIDARVQDIAMTPPSMAGAVGGEMELVASRGSVDFIVRVKTIGDDAQTRVLRMFARYGYTINRFHKFDGLNVMTQFSYWQVLDLSLDASNIRANEMFLNALRGIMEKGVTVYTSPEYIGKNDFTGNTLR